MPIPSSMSKDSQHCLPLLIIFAGKCTKIKYQVECINRFLFTRRRCKYCLVLSIGQRSLTCPVISSSVTEHGGGLHASSDCMLQCCRCRPGHLVRDICKHQLFVTLQHCLGSGEQLEVCGGYRLVHIKYHIKEIFLFFSAAVIRTSRLHEFST